MRTASNSRSLSVLEACALKSCNLSLCHACSVLRLRAAETACDIPLFHEELNVMRELVPCIIIPWKVDVTDLPEALKLLSHFVCPANKLVLHAVGLVLCGQAGFLPRAVRSTPGIQRKISDQQRHPLSRSIIVSTRHCSSADIEARKPCEGRKLAVYAEGTVISCRLASCRSVELLLGW